MKYKGGHFIDVASLTASQISELASLDNAKRKEKIKEYIKYEWTEQDLTSITPMSFVSEMYSICVFLFGVPGCVFTVPLVLLFIGYVTGAIGKTFLIGILALAPLSLLPAPFLKGALSSWYAVQILKYFSFKCIYEEAIEENKPHIMVIVVIIL
jgi:hypothetical protein